MGIEWRLYRVRSGHMVFLQTICISNRKFGISTLFHVYWYSATRHITVTPKSRRTEIANQVVYWLSGGPGRWGWTRVRIPQHAFLQGWVLWVLLTSVAPSDMLFAYTVVEHWILATECECIAFGLSWSLNPCHTATLLTALRFCLHTHQYTYMLACTCTCCTSCSRCTACSHAHYCTIL